MPKVTLLGPPYKTYIFASGKRDFEFHGGEPQDVPVSVALCLQKKLNHDEEPLFSVEDLPEIVDPGQSADEPETILAQEQNVPTTPRQTRFEQWALN